MSAWRRPRRASEPSLYRPDGGVVFVRLAASVKFASVIDCVIHGTKCYRVALMLAERDPVDCHRTILGSWYVGAKGIVVSHALEGRLVAEQKQIEQLHGGGIATGHYHGCAGAAGGIDGAKYAGRLGALILRRLRPGYLVLLTNPDFILPPDL